MDNVAEVYCSNFSLLKHCIISIELFSFASENKDDIALWLSVRVLKTY